MALKIICFEEHMADPALRKAVGPIMQRDAPYHADIGSRHREDPQVPGAFPALRDVRTATEMTLQPIEARLAAMDEAEIDMQILSYTELIQLLPADQAIDLARGANNRLVKTVQARPDRFAGFLTLPWQDAEAASREIERVGRVKGIVGCALAGHAGEGVLVDDPRFEPILAEMADLELPLYIHPGPPLPAVQKPYYGGLNEDASARFSLISYGWHNEAGIQALRLILAGTLDRLPNLKIDTGHWGELVPYYLRRIDDTLPQGSSGLTRTVSQTYKDQVWVGPSGMLYLPNFQFCREVLGIERIVFSIDYPYITMGGARKWLEELPVSEEERAAFAHGNAEKLLRLD